VRSLDKLAHALADHPVADDQWLRGFGYHESVAGDLDRVVLDRLVGDRPLRIQHRSGAAWFLNSLAVESLGIDRAVDAPGVDRLADGRASGRLFRCDKLLREAVTGERAPHLGAVSQHLASCGVTGVTDATATNGKRASHADGRLRRRSSAAARGGHGRVSCRRRITASHAGAVKLLLDECSPYARRCRDIEHAHADGRAVAIRCHCTEMVCVRRPRLRACSPAIASARFGHATPSRNGSPGSVSPSSRSRIPFAARRQLLV
jgi:hypothetical protein